MKRKIMSIHGNNMLQIKKIHNIIINNNNNHNHNHNK